MIVEDLLAEAKAIGITIKLVNGSPVCNGPRGVITPDFIERLKLHKIEIVRYLIGYEHECLFPGTGYIGPHSFPQSGWPSGAYFYRKVGDTEWLPIPGRTWDAERKRGVISNVTKLGMESSYDIHASGNERDPNTDGRQQGSGAQSGGAESL